MDVENEYLSTAELEALAEIDDEVTEESGVDQAHAMPNDDLEQSALLQMAETATDPRVIDQALHDLRQQREALELDYESGESELTYAEHRAKLREIDAALLDLNAERAEASMISRMVGQAAQADWRKQIETTRREARKLGLDLKPGSALEGEWDRAVKFLGSDPDNARQPADWFLKTALQMVASRHGRLATVRDDGHQPHRSRSAPAGLDRLNGLELERALARLTPEEAEAWLNG